MLGQFVVGQFVRNGNCLCGELKMGTAHNLFDLIFCTWIKLKVKRHQRSTKPKITLKMTQKVKKKIRKTRTKIKTRRGRDMKKENWDVSTLVADSIKCVYKVIVHGSQHIWDTMTAVSAAAVAADKLEYFSFLSHWFGSWPIIKVFIEVDSILLCVFVNDENSFNQIHAQHTIVSHRVLTCQIECDRMRFLNWLQCPRIIGKTERMPMFKSIIEKCSKTPLSPKSWLTFVPKGL